MMVWLLSKGGGDGAGCAADAASNGESQQALGPLLDKIRDREENADTQARKALLVAAADTIAAEKLGVWQDRLQSMLVQDIGFSAAIVSRALDADRDKGLLPHAQKNALLALTDADEKGHSMVPHYVADLCSTGTRNALLFKLAACTEQLDPATVARNTAVAPWARSAFAQAALAGDRMDWKSWMGVWLASKEAKADGGARHELAELIAEAAADRGGDPQDRASWMMASWQAAGAARSAIADAVPQIHEDWLDRNGAWAPAELQVPFDQLPTPHQDQDYQALEIALSVDQSLPLREQVLAVAAALHDRGRADRQLPDGTYRPLIKNTSDQAWIAEHGRTQVDIAGAAYADLPQDHQSVHWQAASSAAAAAGAVTGAVYQAMAEPGSEPLMLTPHEVAVIAAREMQSGGAPAEADW